VIEPAIVLPLDYAERIRDCDATYGSLDIKWSARERLALVDGYQEGWRGNRVHRLSGLAAEHHALADLPSGRSAGKWFEVGPELQVAGRQARRVSGALPLDYFRDGVAAGWTKPPHLEHEIAITYTNGDIPGVDIPRWAGWLLSSEPAEAAWCWLDVVDERMPLLAPLALSWPLQHLFDVRVGVIGVGSIGSAVLESLAGYGIRDFTLVDPERLRSHNFARHRVDRTHVGRLKVNAMAERLRSRDPEIEVTPLPLDVLLDADQLRPVLRDLDFVLVCVDGIDARRAANHLIHRASKPAVFACVLEDGAFGEVIRFDPKRTGCLLCARRELERVGGIQPETSLDRGYGTGTRHLPMTAVTSDLGLVGDIAAKVGISTLLEQKGYLEQRLPGDHAVIGLRPKPGRSAPYDVDHAAVLRWYDVPAPSPTCPTCSP
jgi:molybdopterin/thiamine biosynthesis adenylyltransferase